MKGLLREFKLSLRAHLLKAPVLSERPKGAPCSSGTGDACRAAGNLAQSRAQDTGFSGATHAALLTFLAWEHSLPPVSILSVQAFA